MPLGAVLEATEREPLTNSERALYEVLTALCGPDRRPVSLRDLAERSGTSSPTVHYHLGRMEAKGWIRPRIRPGTSGHRAPNTILPA